MLRSASGARADISESFTSAISEQQMGTSGDLSTLSSRKASLAAPPSPVGRYGPSAVADCAGASHLRGWRRYSNPAIRIQCVHSSGDVTMILHIGCVVS